jgi:hypothetical protein
MTAVTRKELSAFEYWSEHLSHSSAGVCEGDTTRAREASGWVPNRVRPSSAVSNQHRRHSGAARWGPPTAEARACRAIGRRDPRQVSAFDVERRSRVELGDGVVDRRTLRFQPSPTSASRRSWSPVGRGAAPCRRTSRVPWRSASRRRDGARDRCTRIAISAKTWLWMPCSLDRPARPTAGVRVLQKRSAAGVPYRYGLHRDDIAPNSAWCSHERPDGFKVRSRTRASARVSNFFFV